MVKSIMVLIKLVSPLISTSQIYFKGNTEQQTQKGSMNRQEHKTETLTVLYLTV